MAGFDGGPAFPIPAQLDGNGQVVNWPQPGMTLRDYFAGQALAGLLANARTDGENGNACIKAAWEAADAMIAHRTL